MNIDRDLRDALHALAGDPVADAQKVLARLPDLPLPPPGSPRWLPWTFLVGGLAIGVVIGVLVTGPGRTQPEPAPSPPPVTPQEPDKPVEKQPPKQPPFDPMDPAQRAQWLYVMGFGPFELDEPGHGLQEFKEGGQLTTLVGTKFLTGGSQLGAHAFANDARFRLDRQTVATIMPDELHLERGRAWLDCGEGRSSVRVTGDLAKIQVDDGSGTFTRGGTTLEVLAIRGTVTVRTSRGETVHLEEQERVAIDAERGAGPKELVPFLGSVNTWMTPMILLSTDPREPAELVTDMVDAYKEGTFRAEARRELRKLGPRSVWQLADSVQQRAARDPAYARETTQLIAELLEWGTIDYAMPLLEAADPEVRVAIFGGIRRATGTDGGTDEAFWREAALERRRTAIESWRKELGF